MSKTIRIPLRCVCGNRDEIDIPAPPCSAECVRPERRMFLDQQPVLSITMSTLQEAEAIITQVREELKQEALVQARLRLFWDKEAAETRKARQTLKKAIRLAEAYSQELGDKAARRICDQFEKHEGALSGSTDETETEHPNHCLCDNCVGIKE